MNKQLPRILTSFYPNPSIEDMAYKKGASDQYDLVKSAYDTDTAALEARIKELEKEQLTPIEAQFLLADYGDCGCKVCKGLVSKLKSIAKGDTK